MTFFNDLFGALVDKIWGIFGNGVDMFSYNFDVDLHQSGDSVVG